jgi:hypothetical protein
MLRNTSASGKSFSEGQILSVPAEISEQDARVLVRMGKAAIVPPEEPKAPDPKEPAASKPEEKKETKND